jgi:hypothetical protein
VRELITDWIQERGTISPEDVYVHNFTLLPPVNIWQNPAANITRSDNADLLWTAFDRSSDYYLPIPSDKGKPGADLPREGAFFLLINKAMEDLRTGKTVMTVLNPYTDKSDLSNWAKAATAYAIQNGIFMPEGTCSYPSSWRPMPKLCHGYERRVTLDREWTSAPARNS